MGENIASLKTFIMHLINVQDGHLPGYAGPFEQHPGMYVLCIVILNLCIPQLETRPALVPVFRIILIPESASSYSEVLMISR